MFSLYEPINEFLKVFLVFFLLLFLLGLFTFDLLNKNILKMNIPLLY